jgi:hypothetical protein
MQTIATIPLAPSVAQSAAKRQALAIFLGNKAALRESQPELSPSLPDVPSGLNWLFGRDGSLTAMEQKDHWWAGCSVPKAAARFMFQNMDVAGAVACFLRPQHAAQLRVALDKLQRRQAILAIVPQWDALSVLLHCEDFSGDLAVGRLWIAGGEDWADQLRAVLERNPGLPTPSQFLRPITSDAESFNQLIGPAQQVFSDVNTTRSQQIQTIRASRRRPIQSVRHVCLLASSLFRLWDDAGEVLAGLDLHREHFSVTRFDPDQPGNSSPLALALAASQADAIVSSNIARSDAAGVVSEQIPWITWITTPRIPKPAQNPSRDRLLVADPAWKEGAIEAGWAAESITVARWPQLQNASFRSRGRSTLAIIADTRPICIPPRVAEYSSQRLMWEFIEQEMAYDPFLLGDVEPYLESRRSQFDISQSNFDAVSFVEGLILPAFMRGIAGLLIQQGLPVRIHGEGWESVPEMGASHVGPIESREQLTAVLGKSAALVNMWPWNHAHPSDGVAIPVVKAFGKDRQSFINRMHAVLRQGGEKEPLSNDQVLDSKLLSNVLRSL